jgi:hypothetical protein
MVGGNAQQVPLDLKPDPEVLPTLGEPRDLPPKQLPGREMERHAAVEVFIAQYPSDT